MKIKRIDIEDLFYMPRSIISEPTRKTLGYIKKHVSKKNDNNQIQNW